MTRFVCVDDQKAAGFPVTAACDAAGVSTSGYYDWCERAAAWRTERQVESAWDPRRLHTLEVRMEHGKFKCGSDAEAVSA